MVAGDRQMESISGPQSGLEFAEIPFGQIEIVGIRQEDREGLVHHRLEPSVGLRRRLGLQSAHSNFAGKEENSILVQWLTVNCSLLNLRTNAAILSLVVSGRTSGTRKLVSK